MLALAANTVSITTGLKKAEKTIGRWRCIKPHVHESHKAISAPILSQYSSCEYLELTILRQGRLARIVCLLNLHLRNAVCREGLWSDSLQRKAGCSSKP